MLEVQQVCRTDDLRGRVRDRGDRFGGPEASWNSGVSVAYHRAASQRLRTEASVTRDEVVRWSACPVIPSGPKVTMVAG
jgi:hypothetical protein